MSVITMPKRFSRYQFALKANKGVAAEGSPLKEYLEYKTGVKKVTYTRDTASNTDGFTPIYLVPFGEGEDIFYLSQISNRALAQVALAGGQSELKYVLVSAITNQITSESNKYTPAAATVFKAQGDGTSPPSKITGVEYRKRGGSSFTFPFGKAAAAEGAAATFKVRAKAIKAAAIPTNSNNTVSFRPEILRSF